MRRQRRAGVAAGCWLVFLYKCKSRFYLLLLGAVIKIHELVCLCSLTTCEVPRALRVECAWRCRVSKNTDCCAEVLERGDANLGQQASLQRWYCSLARCNLDLPSSRRTRTVRGTPAATGVWTSPLHAVLLLLCGSASEHVTCRHAPVVHNLECPSSSLAWKASTGMCFLMRACQTQLCRFVCICTTSTRLS